MGADLEIRNTYPTDRNFLSSSSDFYDEELPNPNRSRRTAKAYDFSARYHWTMETSTVFVVLSWYVSNIGVVLLNKYLLSIYGFKYPVFLTLCHMIACTVLSYAVSLSGMVPRQGVKSKQQFLKISALALVFCGSVVCGNISLRYLPVSFNQAIGSTTPFFTAIFSAVMLGQVESVNTYIALLPVVVGIILASGSEPLFNMYGFIVCVSATAGRAFKSVLQGILLYADTEKLNSINLLLFMAPISVIALIPATIILENGAASKAASLASENFGFVLLLLLNSVMAYFVNLTNFLVTKHTSPLTLQVLGNAKGVVATIVSILIFRNPVSTAGMIGYTITVFGVILYSESKKRSVKQQKKMEIMEKDNDLVEARLLTTPRS
mmetsp:Transcript_7457/g.12863  ORF Transcript_7457/g.12863 Transcript_7457/m.12863 type:complete len:379 (-) Transcript_7457:506-1642(-)|eukprot:CAMPEP_0198211556 /NCGR_PEP_ID=MMETSP1445-20131203/24462_1 /TAXON_ID=36898 /ORGANISM="Pyramimonas sp., Strain CCMP2087" /LENGTH=378 /DNA_ID=CAMNT_0043885831 /DNA_START=297 /DNA_END=1433 /DNA_ORIENTATION=+